MGGKTHNIAFNIFCSNVPVQFAPFTTALVRVRRILDMFIVVFNNSVERVKAVCLQILRCANLH